MTNIGGGIYGPIIMKQKPSEKHWPVETKWRFKDPKYVAFLLTTDSMEKYLPSKFYGTEYYDED